MVSAAIEKKKNGEEKEMGEKGEIEGGRDGGRKEIRPEPTMLKSGPSFLSGNS